MIVIIRKGRARLAYAYMRLCVDVVMMAAVLMMMVVVAVML